MNPFFFLIYVFQIEALPSISREVGHRVDIYLDCGIRHGTDVFKALALGAKMVHELLIIIGTYLKYNYICKFHFQVFLAQPILWGLTYNGQKGVEDVLGIIINEFDNTMALAGIYLFE